MLESKRYGQQARELFADAQKILKEALIHKKFRPKLVFGMFPCKRVGEDVVLYKDETCSEVLETLSFLRQQRQGKDGKNYLSLADFIRPEEQGLDYIGSFVVTIGKEVEQWADSLAADKDDYTSIMIKAVGDRLAEALAEAAHKWVRDLWGYGKEENLSFEDLVAEKYRGIRPAPGYPACPDHTEKATIWRLLDAEKQTGVKLTESFAMTPTSSVSGLYFAHPEAKYFRVGQILEDQVADYAVRKGMEQAEVEKWLAPNLAYDPQSE